MQAKELIETRRSIRRFKDTPVTPELLRQVVDLASNAPSWKNSQTAAYIAVTDTAVKTKIAEDATMAFSKNKDNINGAPALIVLTTRDGVSGYEPDGKASTSKGEHWQSFDAGIAAQTLCLSAHEYGLGTVILGIYQEDKVREILGLPEDIKVSALIPIGFPDEQPDKRPRKSADELLRIV
ncbi:MAG: nitroreductase family protein [Ruminococcus sp.]|nr:nitroreductase family protein [Ruminococcus sp.]